jgi:hypothetical protein
MKKRETHVFKALDVNSDGTLSKAEMIVAAAKINMTEREASALFDQLDVNGDGTVTWEEFHNSRIDVAGRFQGIIPKFIRNASKSCCCCFSRKTEQRTSHGATEEKSLE